MTRIDEIVDNAMRRAGEQLAAGKLDLRSIVYLAVQAGMADAYERGMATGARKKA